MPEELNRTLDRLDATLGDLTDLIRATQASIIKAAADAARAAEDVKRERWWRRVTMVALLIMCFGLGGFLYDTRAEAAAEKDAAEREATETCLRGNRTREQIQTAIVVGVLQTLAEAEDGVDSREARLIDAVSQRVDEEIPERDCE
jgi:cell division protein FtsX